jgi:hypothetical protein
MGSFNSSRREKTPWGWLLDQSRQRQALLPSQPLRHNVHLCSLVASLWTALISPILLAIPLQVEQETGPRLWQTWAPHVIIISTICDVVSLSKLKN